MYKWEAREEQERGGGGTGKFKNDQNKFGFRFSDDIFSSQ